MGDSAALTDCEILAGFAAGFKLAKLCTSRVFRETSRDANVAAKSVFGVSNPVSKSAARPCAAIRGDERAKRA